jgi:HrpA-like RNA helicase
VPKSLVATKKAKSEVPKSPIIDRFITASEPLIRNAEIDEKLRKLFLEKRNKSNYQRFQGVRAKLPAVAHRIEVLKAVLDNQVVLISGILSKNPWLN